MAPPETATKEKDLVIEKARRDQPQRTKGAHDVVGIVLGIIHMGVVLEVHPREHREAEAEQQRSAMAHHRIPEAVGMGGVVAGIVNHRALEVESQETEGQQRRQRPAPHEPAPDGERSQAVASEKEAHRGIPGRRCIQKLLRHAAHRWRQAQGLWIGGRRRGGKGSRHARQDLRHQRRSDLKRS